MRTKFLAVAGALSMVVTSSAAIAAATPFASSPLDQRPSQLQVSHRKGEKLEDGSQVTPGFIVAIIILATIPAVVITKIVDEDASPA